MAMCDPHNPAITPVQRAFVKHQSRAVVGRLALRNASWSHFGGNPYGWCGLTDLVDYDTGETCRMMHVGDRTFTEGERRESQASLPQGTRDIMAVARGGLWEIGRASCRERGEISGVGGALKKKKK